MLNSPLCKNILSINKFKKDNTILVDSLYVFNNALTYASYDSIVALMKMDLIRLIAEGINKSDNPNVMLVALNTLFYVIKYCRIILKSDRNLKYELAQYNCLIKIEKMVNHLNEHLSKRADEVLKVLEDINYIFDDKMECDI